MKKENVLSASLLAADFGELLNDVRESEAAGLNTLHFDVMDGDFVPNISYGAVVIEALRKKSESFFDVHMMVREPGRYVPDMIKAGADGITVHLEACSDAAETIRKIREAGIKPGLAINPETAAELVQPYLSEIDMVLVMSVHPGFGGQRFIPETLEKVEALRQIIDREGYDCRIGIDGGIGTGNAAQVSEKGADFLIAGSSIFRPKEKIRENTAQLLRILKGNS